METLEFEIGQTVWLNPCYVDNDGFVLLDPVKQVVIDYIPHYKAYLIGNNKEEEYPRVVHKYGEYPHNKYFSSKAECLSSIRTELDEYTKSIKEELVRLEEEFEKIYFKTYSEYQEK